MQNKDPSWKDGPLGIAGKVLALDTTTAVVPQEAAETSVASGASLSTVIAGQVLPKSASKDNTFIVHTRDAEDNPRSTDTTSAITGYMGSTPAVPLSFSYLGGGNYTATINPVSAGDFPMHVLVNGPLSPWFRMKMGPPPCSYFAYVSASQPREPQPSARAMAARAYFLAVFAPEGWPTSVAPEYGRYQLWDTIQQVTFFVNTVACLQAVMKFHGVGDPDKTPAEATALQMGRDLLATVIGMGVATPAFTDRYRSAPRSFRMSAEVVNAVGHFVEILAAIFSGIVAFLYLGPALCLVAGTMSGAVRSVILQHFAKGGRLPPGRDPDFGDISLKESNQDRGGKIFGLFIGMGLLLGAIGIGSGAEAEQESLEASLRWFAVLSVVHLLGNVQAVRQLDIATPGEAPQPATLGEARPGGFLRQMFLPKGFPSTVVASYGRFRAWALLQVLIGYPKQVVINMLFWGQVYGVGNAQSSPVTAVLIDIFMTTIDCVMGLLLGLPAVTQSLDYSKKRWFIYSGVLGRCSEFVQLAAALAPSRWFFPIIVLARSLAAFSGTSGSRVGGAIPPAFMRKEKADRKEIELIHVNVANGNQDKLVSVPSGVLSISFLYYLVFSGWHPSLSWQIAVYCALQALSFCSLCGCFRNLPPLPGEALQEPLVGRKVSDVVWEEQNDMDSEVLNSYSGPASNPPALVRSLSIDIVGSPFTTRVEPGPTSAVHSLITGTGLQFAEAGVEGVFYVTLRDAQLNHRGTSIGEPVTLDDSRMNCADQGLGVYRCSYLITQAQTFNVVLRVNGQPVNPVAPHTFPLVINPKPIDSTAGVNYIYAFTTFFPEIRKSTDNSVIFQVRDEFGNDVPDEGNNFMICEADGPEQRTPPFRPPLDIVRHGAGLFRVNLKLDTTGLHKVYCYALNKGGINARYFNNRWVEGVPAISQVDTAIDFNWGEGLVTAESSDYASAQFDGYLQVLTPANYTFYITADDGAKMWMDDELILSQDEAGQFQTRPILLTGDRLYHIQVMYYERTGFARMRLEWSSDQGLVREVIGKDSWFHSRSRLGLFPQQVLVYDKPGPVEAFYHHDFQYDVNQLSWVPPQDSSAKPILGYRLYRDNGMGGAIDNLMATTDENTFSYMDSGLVTGLVYYYRLMAVNGDDGEPVTISAQPSVPPIKPDPALLINTASGSMTFRFTPLTGAASGWSPTIRYTLYRNDGLGGVLRFTYEGDMDGTSMVELMIGGLVEGRQYLFQTSYWSRIGQSPLSDVTAVVCCEFRKPGSPPLNLRRSGDQSNEKISLAWDAVTDIGTSSLIYYRLYMDDGYTEISKNTASGTTTTEFFEFLTPGNPYRFAVAAVNAAGEGPRSERITLTASDVAGQPFDVEATFQSSYRIDLQWKKPLLTGASGMSGYKVWVDDGNGGGINNLIWDGGTKAATLSYSWAPVFSDGTVALLAGHTYRFQVQSVNPTGDGARSNIFSIVAASKPDAPGRPGVDRAATSATAVHISWAAPYNGGSPILGYIVERKSSPTAQWISLTAASDSYTSTTYVDTFQLVARSFYIYRVSAFNLVSVGETFFSPESSIPAAAVPTAPTVSFVTSTETTITVAWDIPTSDLTVTGFRLYVDNVLKYDGAGVSTVRTFTLAGCTTGNMHDFRATAISDAGESGLSASLPRFCARRPYPPAQPTLKSTTLSTVEIQWVPPTNNGGMPISGYKVQRSNNDVYFFGTVQCEQPDGSFLTTLPEDFDSCLDSTAFICPQRRCKYRVLAINGVEDDNFADVSPYLVATAADLPNPPTSVTRDDPPISKTAIEVHWSPVTDAAETGGALVTGYRVYANTGIDDALAMVFDGSGSPSIRSFKHTGLVPGRRYWYQVTSLSSVGEGSRTNISTFLAAEPPAAPLQPRFVTAGFGSITIGLDPPPSDGGSPIVRYVIYRNDGTVNGLLSTQVSVCDMSRTQFDVPDLLLGRDYLIQVQAHADCPYGAGNSLHEYDADGICVNDGDCTLPGARSGIALFTTTDVPDTVTLEKVVQARTSVTFRFDPPPGDGGSPVTSFEPYRDDGLGGDFVRVDVLPTNYFEMDTDLSESGNEYKYTGLVTGRRYNFFVASCNKRGCRSGVIFGPLTAAAAPDQPEPPLATATSAVPPMINLTWTPPGATAVVQYRGYQGPVHASNPFPSDNGGMPILKTEIQRDDGQAWSECLPKEGRDLLALCMQAHVQRLFEAFPGLPCSGGREMPSALAQLEGGGFAQAPVSSRKGLGGPKAESSPVSGISAQDLPTDSPVRPSVSKASPGAYGRPVDGRIPQSVDFEAEILAKRVAAGDASEDSLDEAAHLLLQALPAAMDPYGFKIPPPSAWAEQEAERAEPARTAAATAAAAAAAAEGISGGRGVPLRLVAQQPDVAWEVDGQLQLLIGAAKRPCQVQVGAVVAVGAGFLWRSSEQDGVFSLLAEVDAPDLTYSDTSVTAGLTYRYRIRMHHEQSASDFSNLATFVAAGLPDQPAAVTLVSQSKSEITVSWTTPAANGADVYQFILRRDDGLGSTLTPIYRGAATIFTSADLATGRYYSFSIAARNAAGEGPASQVQRFLSASMPSPVGQPALQTSSCTGGSISFKWSVPEDDGGCPVIRYRILRDGAATGTEVSSTTVTYFTAGLECATSYLWSVEAKNCLDIWGRRPSV
ncbi:Ttn [Symbiodinium sp. KB8]|nr:Ttn [Symbiodinium sp. KB8]